ncbi:MAG: lipoprotein-releasing ABC transporter permease subunit [Deltaproteobacteria bacterium]|nr:lipoprotein-releasing ABC transporter permease subunit [Deltaproteobacteria bacterium]
MRYELFIGLRYLRPKRREGFISLITMFSTIGVLLGVMTLNIVMAVMTGFEEDLRDRILGFNPHIILSNLGGGISDYPSTVEKVRGTPGVVAAAPIVYGQGMVSSRQNVSGVMVRAVEPDHASDIVNIAPRVKRGTMDTLGREQKVTIRESGEDRTVALSGILIGQELAKQLKVAVGDPISLISPSQSTPGPMGMVPKLRRFVVVGVFDSGMAEYDALLIYMGLADAQKFFELGDRVTGIEVRVDNVYAAQAIAQEIEGVLGLPYQARDWTQINRNIFVALKMEKILYFVVLLLIILVAAFNIVAMLIMVVMEKRKDIAVLKSLGATSQSIGRIFIYKGIIIGVIGTLLGTLLGYVGCWVLANYEIIKLPIDVFYVKTLPVKIYLGNFLMVAASSMAICLLATIYPARQAANLAPVEVIRYE